MGLARSWEQATAFLSNHLRNGRSLLKNNGNFKVETKNPMMVIGNTWDAHTPLISAHNVSSGLEGSVMRQVDGWGAS
ncbi:hypothetical protein BJ878DRAFT_517199 [Calycina marina]|uniref:Peptidase S33 tripeptidyl aminopeptidase-like C-terminal domain-containing protein n=1 Tax=Calycina marina TaxID=1763456 RepID=A0A9P8CCL3_9HELO|nr:hypothetical protein BJ878DRAFT_517199 [Calycina marina]